MKRIAVWVPVLAALAACAGAQPAPSGPPPSQPTGRELPSLPRPPDQPSPSADTATSAAEPAESASAAPAASATSDVPPGPLDKTSIRTVIRSWYPEVKGCYERAFRDNQSLHGKVIARFMIGEDGSVSSVDMSDSTIKNKEVTDCVGKLFGLMRFPKPANGMVLITYPLEFDSEIKAQ